MYSIHQTTKTDLLQKKIAYKLTISVGKVTLEK